MAQATITLAPSVRAQALWQDDMDLGTASEDSSNSQTIEGKLRAYGQLTPGIDYLWEGRAVKNFGDSGGEDPITGESLGTDDFLEWRQSWLEFKNIANITPLSVRIGRQRFTEPYTLWWSRDLDAIRLIYDTTLTKSFVAVGENLMSYRTNGEDFNEDDENILRVLGEHSWQYQYGHFLEGRFLYQNDHSGSEIGSVVDASDPDSTDSNLLWAGLRLRGELPTMEYAKATGNYRFDLIGLGGTDDIQETAGGVVTGEEDSDVLAWAFDAGADIPLPLQFDPVVTLGLAYGSGDNDDTDGTNHNFRQTGLDGNLSRPGISSGTLNNYGSVLRPDLSNITVFTAGVGVPMLKASDLSFIYHYYHLNDTDGDLISSGIDAPLTGDDHDIGHGVDLIFNMNLSKETGCTNRMIDNMSFKATAGLFHAGDAYGDAEGETAMRGLVEFVYRF